MRQHIRINHYRIYIKSKELNMTRLSELAKDCAHQRRIEMSTYPVDETHILARGRFIEERIKPYFKFTGERVEGGPLHNLEILLLVKIPELVIEDVEVITGTLPRADCYKIENPLEPVKGLAIKSGFTSKVKDLLGGVKGCTHLTHLLCTMAPAVMQGFWAISYQKKYDKSEKSKSRASKMGFMLKNTCYAWREDGEAYQKMMKLLEGEK